MNLQNFINIITNPLTAVFISMWALFFSKTLPEIVFGIAEHRGPRFIMGFLLLMVPLVDWWIHVSASSTNLGWYDWIFVGMGASAISLLFLPQSSWFDIVGEVVLGPIGAVVGGSFLISRIHVPNFYVAVGVIFFCGLVLITFWRLVEYYFEEVTDASRKDRFAMGFLFLIETFMIWWILSSFSHTVTLAWYHFLIIGIGVSALSFFIPSGDDHISIIGETLIGPAGAFIGGWLAASVLTLHSFYASMGVIILSALILIICYRLLYYLYQSYKV